MGSFFARANAKQDQQFISQQDQQFIAQKCAPPKSVSMQRLQLFGQLHNDRVAVAKFRALGFDIVPVSWEDTSRYKNSCWGSNITDQVIVTRFSDNTSITSSIIRSDNFFDKTVDVALKDVFVNVGNEVGASALKQVPLKEFLQLYGWYCPRDDQGLLCSTQTCVIPLVDGKATFEIQFHNYQTRRDDPSLAVITSTAQGTSVTPITTYNQTMYFNKNGRARLYQAQRLEDERKESQEIKENDRKDRLDLTVDEMSKSAILCFHVPLKQRNSFGLRSMSMGSTIECYGEKLEEIDSREGIVKLSKRGLDAAVISVADKDMGPFEGVRGEKYERDTTKPIRLVIQNYVATDTCELTESDVNYIVRRLNAPFWADRTQGSLVVDVGDKNRPTETTTTSSDVDGPPPLPRRSFEPTTAALL